MPISYAGFILYWNINLVISIKYFKIYSFRPVSCHFPAGVWRSKLFKQDAHSTNYGIFCIVTRTYAGWSKSLCAPDGCVVIVRCIETFWSPCLCKIIVKRVKSLVPSVGHHSGLRLKKIILNFCRMNFYLHRDAAFLPHCKLCSSGIPYRNVPHLLRL